MKPNTPMRNEYFNDACNTLLAPTWKIWLAVLFGKKSVGSDSGCTITCYRYKGITYVTDVKLEQS